MKSTDEYSKALAAIHKRYEDDLVALGERVRVELVVPACRRHRLTFVSGMGSFDFKRKADEGDYNAATYSEGKDLDVYEGLSEAAKRTLRPILDLLNEELEHNQYLGWYVADVR